uniref:Uncharacterized protein n=1 Tax=Arundo donax TaxID=35708 RepID=A0A0A9FFP3_ARUDO
MIKLVRLAMYTVSLIFFASRCFVHWHVQSLLVLVSNLQFQF